MGKTVRKKPGPKSMTESRMLLGRGTLGESSSSDDDSSPDNTTNKSKGQRDENIVSPRRSSARKAVDVSEYRTPDRENDMTDYGLEFTTSHIRRSRRCSTMMQTGNSQDKEQSDGNPDSNARNQESEEPLSVNAKTNPSKKANPRQSNRKGSELEQPQTSSAATTGRDLTVRRPRKQKTPLQREKRFWKEVRRLESSAKNMIPMLPFSRLVRELIMKNTIEVTKITPVAMEALQTASEMYITQVLQDAYMLTIHRGRVTLDVKDLELVKYFQINY